MKKYTSAALLALKLTWTIALLIFLLTAAVQAFLVWRELMPGGVPLQTTFGFENLVRATIAPAGKWWSVMLLVFVGFRTAASKGSRTIYTMNRLGLSELQITLVFGLVFTGYFLLYWVFQLAVAYGFFVWYSRFTLVSSNALMLSCWRSEWLHTLLPLAEWWGYLRNLAICGSFGFSAAFGGTLARHGKLPLASLVPPVLCVFLMVGEIGEALPDLLLAALLIAFSIGYYFVLKEGADHEDL